MNIVHLPEFKSVFSKLMKTFASSSIYELWWPETLSWHWPNEPSQRLSTEQTMTSVVGCKMGNELSCILGSTVVTKQNCQKCPKRPKNMSTDKFGNGANDNYKCWLQTEKLSCDSGRSKYIGYLLIYHASQPLHFCNRPISVKRT